jgi:methionyl-tRNA formyltransferase
VRVVFMGSGRFAVPSLVALLDAGHDVAAVLTQPDREQGRGRKLLPPPLKPAALERGLTVLQPERLRHPALLSRLRETAAELHVVVAYGRILPPEMLAIPALGNVNVHGSLLPRYRGAAPIAWAIVNGEAETGVTTMLLDAGMDTGPTLLHRATAIGPEETAGELEPRLAAIGGSLLVETLQALHEGRVVPQPQDPRLASYAPLLTKEHGRIDWGLAAPAVERRIRGFQPWPGAFTHSDGRLLKLLKARVEAGRAGGPGTLLAVDGNGILVACGESSALRLTELQPESRRGMSAAAFAAGARLRAGDRFD